MTCITDASSPDIRGSPIWLVRILTLNLTAPCTRASRAAASLLSSGERLTRIFLTSPSNKRVVCRAPDVSALDLRGFLSPGRAWVWSRDDAILKQQRQVSFAFGGIQRQWSFPGATDYYNPTGVARGTSARKNPRRCSCVRTSECSKTAIIAVDMLCWIVRGEMGYSHTLRGVRQFKFRGIWGQFLKMRSLRHCYPRSINMEATSNSPRFRG